MAQRSTCRSCSLRFSLEKLFARDARPCTNLSLTFSQKPSLLTLRVAVPPASVALWWQVGANSHDLSHSHPRCPSEHELPRQSPHALGLALVIDYCLFPLSTVLTIAAFRRYCPCKAHLTFPDWMRRWCLQRSPSLVSWPWHFSEALVVDHTRKESALNPHHCLGAKCRLRSRRGGRHRDHERILFAIVSCEAFPLAQGKMYSPACPLLYCPVSPQMF